MLSGINHQLGRNKRLKNDWPFRIGVLDGHEFFSLPSALLSPMFAAAAGGERRGGGGILSPRGGLYLVGFRTAVPLDLEMLRPGEGELTAASVFCPGWSNPMAASFDAVLGDALYFNAPFFNLCLGLGKEVITVLKDEDRVLFQDAQGVFSLTAPQAWKRRTKRSRLGMPKGSPRRRGFRFPCASCGRKRSSPADIGKDRLDPGTRNASLGVGDNLIGRSALDSPSLANRS